MFGQQFHDAEALLHEALADLDPATVSGRDAARLTEVCAVIERLGAAAKTLFARRASETGCWRGGRAATEEQWLAELSGSTESAARESLATARRLDSLPATAEKLRDGELSLGQASLVSQGATADPHTEQRLLKTAKRSGMRRLRDEKERVVAAATDELDARRRAKRNRHLRTYTGTYETRGSFSGPTEEVAEILSALKPLTEARFHEARRAGEHEGTEAYRFDALVTLSRSGGAGATAEKAPAPNPHVARVRVDLSALLRGRTESGEICEIPGVGPVPVDHARKLLSHGLLQLVLTKGRDVLTVVSNTRDVPLPLRIAIDERDQTCRIRGCDCSEHLERHHVEGFAAGGETSYGNLGRLCPRHHDLLTHRGYEIVLLDDGDWDLRAPPNAAAA